MGNSESRQDHYEVLGVNPGATETRITQAFREKALKWHPKRRTRGDIDVAYRVLINSKKRASYDASSIVVVGYVTYKLWKSGKLEQISRATIDKIYSILGRAAEIKDSDSSYAFQAQLASSAGSAQKIAVEKLDTFLNWASELKDSDAVSALGSKLASSAGSVASASKEGLSKAAKWFQN